MNSKHTKAIVLSLISIAVFFTVVASLLSGAISIQVLFDQPINSLSFMIAAMAMVAVVVMSIILGTEKSRSCKNKSCSFNPHYVEAADSTYKDMTGVLNMSELIAAEAPMGGAQISVKLPDAPAPATDAVAQTLSDQAIVGSNAPQIIPGMMNVSPETTPTVADAENDNLGKVETHVTKLNTSGYLLNSDALEDIEEPHERPSMDFTDDMIPLIIANLYRLNMDAARKKALASAYAMDESGTVAGKNAITGNFASGAYRAFIANKELSGKAAAIGWLFEAPEHEQVVTAGKHFKIDAAPLSTTNMTPQMVAQLANQPDSTNLKPTAQPPHLKLLVAS